jgi:vancomycin permeability regulator SanA
MMLVYGVLWLVSTITFGIMVELLLMDQWISWAINTTAFGFLTFLGLRLYAFPVMDGRITRKERLDSFLERRRA